MGRKLHVGNLPFSATDEELLVKFGQFGMVESAKIIRDASTGTSKRFAVVEMSSDADALAAIHHLNMTQFDEATMSVSEARSTTGANEP